MCKYVCMYACACVRLCECACLCVRTFVRFNSDSFCWNVYRMKMAVLVHYYYYRRVYTMIVVVLVVVVTLHHCFFLVLRRIWLHTFPTNYAILDEILCAFIDQIFIKTDPSLWIVAFVVWLSACQIDNDQFIFGLFMNLFTDIVEHAIHIWTWWIL